MYKYVKILTALSLLSAAIVVSVLANKDATACGNRQALRLDHARGTVVSLTTDRHFAYISFEHEGQTEWLICSLKRSFVAAYLKNQVTEITLRRVFTPLPTAWQTRPIDPLSYMSIDYTEQAWEAERDRAFPRLPLATPIW